MRAPLISKKLGPFVLAEQPIETGRRERFVYLEDDGAWGLTDGGGRPVDEHIPCTPVSTSTYNMPVVECAKKLVGSNACRDPACELFLVLDQLHSGTVGIWTDDGQIPRPIVDGRSFRTFGHVEDASLRVPRRHYGGESAKGGRGGGGCRRDPELLPVSAATDYRLKPVHCGSELANYDGSVFH